MAAPQKKPKPGEPKLTGQDKGTLRITPDGDRRIVIDDVRGRRASGGGPEPAELSLYQILCDGRSLEGLDGKAPLVFKPVTIDAMAIISEMNSQGIGGPTDDAAKAFRDTVKLATVILNDGAKDKQGAELLTEEQVGRLINTKNYHLVVKAIAEVADPLFGGPSQTQGETGTGSRSSTSSPSGSSGDPGKLAV